MITSVPKCAPVKIVALIVNLCSSFIKSRDPLAKPPLGFKLRMSITGQPTLRFNLCEGSPLSSTEFKVSVVRNCI